MVQIFIYTKGSKVKILSYSLSSILPKGNGYYESLYIYICKQICGHIFFFPFFTQMAAYNTQCFPTCFVHNPAILGK